VRKVLLDAGMEFGLKNDSSGARLSYASDRPASRPPRAQAIPPVPGPELESWTLDRLLGHGFELLGSCRLVSSGSFEYAARAPDRPGVYAFALDASIVYVGLTRGSLLTRLGHYAYGHERQRTSARVKQLILAELIAGRTIQVCTASPPALSWNGLPVDGPAGLETGLIRLIQPPWNMSGLK
jgi:hypothetical protein